MSTSAPSKTTSNTGCPDCGFVYAYRGYWVIECANPFCARVTVKTMRDYRDQTVRNGGEMSITWMQAAKTKGYEAPELAPALRKQQEETNRIYEEVKRQLNQMMSSPYVYQPIFSYGMGGPSKAKSP